MEDCGDDKRESSYEENPLAMPMAIKTMPLATTMQTCMLMALDDLAARRRLLRISTNHTRQHPHRNVLLLGGTVADSEATDHFVSAGRVEMPETTTYSCNTPNIGVSGPVYIRLSRCDVLYCSGSGWCQQPLNDALNPKPFPKFLHPPLNSKRL